MILTRVIPCLLIHNGGLYKTTKFKKPNYIGDPINAVKLFNEKQASELIVIDIDASVKNHYPNFKLIEEIASEAFMPICYGGGVKNIEHMQRIFSSGIEKISVSSLLFEDLEMVKKAVKKFGSSSIVATIDTKKTLFKKQRAYIYNGKKKLPYTIDEVINLLQDSNVGELVVNSIDNDGTMGGYDLNLIQYISKQMNIPVVALGGAGSLDDIIKVIKKGGASAASAGSLFVYHGPRKGVLINYPNEEKLDNLLK